MICNYCWKNVDEFSSSDDLCLDCHRKHAQTIFSDEVGASYGQIKWLVSELNKKTRRIAEIEAENEKLRAASVFQETDK